MESDEDPSWNSYPNTILEFPGGVVIDLRAKLSDSDRQALASFFPGPFAIISAADPKGHNENPDVNMASAVKLRREIARRAFMHVQIIGRSADGGHEEASFAIALSIVEAKRLATDADQSAYFWYDG